MLDDFGLHSLIWNLADQVVSDILVASPMDAGGRGIALSVRENGAAADLDGATAYLVWTHRGTGKRGTTEFEEVDASAGTFQVCYPAAMCEAGGIVDASVMLSLGGGRYLSTRNFNIRVERVLIDGLEPEDGFTLFVQAIAAYENASDITTDAADAATAAAEAASAAADDAAQAVADLRAAAESGDFDGADGADGFSPVATVTQTASGGATITITDKNGTTTADIARGAQGEKGEKGDAGEQGPKGETGDTGPQGIQGERGLQGEKGETGAIGAQGPQGETGPKGDTGATGPQGEQGPRGETGEQGPQGVQGETGPKGDKGDDGDDGVSCTHSWNGTVLSVTSASGTSSADLVGPQGPTGATGATGPAGADGTVFAPVSPLSLSGGELSIDLSDYSATSDLPPAFFASSGYPHPKEGELSATTRIGSDTYSMKMKESDIILDTTRMVFSMVNNVSVRSGYLYATVEGLLDLGALRSLFVTEDVDVEPGGTGSGTVAGDSHSWHVFPEGCLFFNPDTGNLMSVTAEAVPARRGASVSVSVEGLCNLYEPEVDLTGYARLTGATFTGAVSGVTPTATAHLATKGYVDGAVPDLTGYATQAWVNTQIANAISALDDLSEEEF